MHCAMHMPTVRCRFCPGSLSPPLFAGLLPQFSSCLAKLCCARLLRRWPCPAFLSLTSSLPLLQLAPLLLVVVLFYGMRFLALFLTFESGFRCTCCFQSLSFDCLRKDFVEKAHGLWILFSTYLQHMIHYVLKYAIAVPPPWQPLSTV